MILGITGTRLGWRSIEQRKRAEYLLCGLHPHVLIHGDCIGIDEEVHRFVRAMNSAWHTKIEIYPSNDSRNRAFCKDAAIVHEPLPSLERNRLIVDACELLLAVPKGETSELRSGTWATIRYAKLVSRATLIVGPSGQVEVR
jgi:hypothetical protein